MRHNEDGFTLIELMVASMVTLVIMGVAFSSFRDALALNESVLSLADASQNLRAGTNLLVRDFLQAGRNIETGGIPIPSGPDAEPVHRPGPQGSSYVFENSEAGTTLMAITTGNGLGPTNVGRETDKVTIVMDDPFHSHLDVFSPLAPTTRVRLANDGASLDVAGTGWVDGDPDNRVSPIVPGDLIYFNGTSVGSAIQTVTRVEGSVIYFDASDPFNLNQRGVEAGSITQILPETPQPCDDNTIPCNPIMKVRRVYMYTYYVDSSYGVPRLMRAVNQWPPTALAGVIEDLDLSYDLVDGVVNPTAIDDLPFTADDGATYAASQIRKANVHVGVRSEDKSTRTKDYLRNHLSTVISLRNLAYVDRYE